MPAHPPAAKLLRHPITDWGEFISVTPEDAGWEYLHFAVRRLAAREVWTRATGPDEYGLVILGGTCAINSSRGHWEPVGRRPHVFSGMPYALYLPRDTEFILTAGDAGCEVGGGREEKTAEMLLLRWPLNQFIRCLQVGSGVRRKRGAGVRAGGRLRRFR